MKTLRWIPACTATLIFIVLSFSLLGVKFHYVNHSLNLELANVKQLIHVIIATVIVFSYQLLRNHINKHIKFTFSFIPSSQSVTQLLQVKSTRYLVNIGLLLFLVLFPFIVSRSSVDIATLTLIYIMLGLGLNIVVGLAGLLDLGYVGFYAVGAYGYALLNQYLGIDFWTALVFCGLLAAFFGLILGFPVLRLRGDYLAIVTLGFGEIIRILLNNLSGITNGPNGIGQIPKPTFFGIEFTKHAKNGGVPFHEFFGIHYSSMYKVIFLYFIALCFVILIVFVINRLLRMPIGRAWEALREDEIACRSLGLNPTVIKLSAFTIGATFAGFSGAFFAARQGFISPESFTFTESAIVLAIVVLGGMGSQIGVILAAIILTVLPELTREFQEYRMLMFGLIMICVMLWSPEGLIPLKRPHLEIKKKTQKYNDNVSSGNPI